MKKILPLLLLLAAVPAGAQTYNGNGEQLNACRVWDGVDFLDIIGVDTVPTDSLKGLLTASGIYGHTTAGGTSWVAVKVSPSGALQVDASGSPVPITPPANQTIDLNLIGGTPVDTGSGNQSSGTQRVILATDQPAVPVSGNVGLTGTPSVNSTIVSPLSTAAPTTTASAVTVRQAMTNRTSSGTLGALNATLSLSAEGMGAVGFEVDAGLVGTVLLEATIDGTNWWTIEVYDLPNKDTQASIVTADLPFRGRSTVIAVASLRLRVSAYTSGSSAARMLGTLGPAITSSTSGGGGGLGTQVEGMAADGTAVSGNPLLMGAEAMSDGSSPSAVSAGQATRLLATTEGRLLVSQDHPRRFRCLVQNASATTIQAIGGDCAAPGAGLSLYVTGISFSVSAASTTTANQYAQILYGTGGTCGTGQTLLWVHYHPANQAIVDPMIAPPYKIPANNELCWQDAVTGSKNVNIRGYIAP